VEPLTFSDVITTSPDRQVNLARLLETTPLATELEEIFACIPYKALEVAILTPRVRAFRPLGRLGYPISVLLKTLMAGYVLGVKNTNDLLRRMQEDPILSTICGFECGKPPCRRTIYRFTKKLIEHQGLVDRCFDKIVDRLSQTLPRFGDIVAMDGTPVHSHSNPDKHSTTLSDPQAGWVYKEGNKNKRWVWGYHFHLVADATYELPIAKALTVYNEAESAMAIPILKTAKETFKWFHPEAVICDKGYDSAAIFESIVKDIGADPIINIRNRASGDAPEITGSSADPICPGGLPLIYRSWDKSKGSLQYQCPEKAGKAICPLADKCTIKRVWIKPVHDYRRFGYRIKRGTNEFKELYQKRTAIERVNSRLKDKRRLDSHCLRGLQKLALHCTLSVIAMNAMALAKAQAGEWAELRCSSRKVG